MNVQRLHLPNELERKKPKGEKLIFTGIGNKDAFNVSYFEDEANGDRFVIARVEPRPRETESLTMFFAEENGICTLDPTMPVYCLQDFKADKLDGIVIGSGVETYPKPTKTDPNGLGWHVAYLRGPNIRELKKFFIGPDMMKNIRLGLLADERIGIITRPNGQIGFTTCDSLDDICIDAIMKAKVIKGLLRKGEWGGFAGIHLLPNGLIGAWGHKARYIRTVLPRRLWKKRNLMRISGPQKKYEGIACVFDPKSLEGSKPKTIVTRSDFPAGECKKEDLRDIFYPLGMKRNSDDTAIVYGGLSDAEGGRIEIPDPYTHLNDEEKQFMSQHGLAQSP